MGTKERAAELRKTLKEHGWNGRKVSVRTEYYSMGSSIHVTVRDPEVPISEIRKIAAGFEDISRDEATGDILSGGNTYVDVRVSDSVRETYRGRWLSTVEKTIKSRRKAGLDSNTLEKIPSTKFHIGEEGGNFTLWGDRSQRGRFYSAEAVAEFIGQEMVGKE